MPTMRAKLQVQSVTKWPADGPTTQVSLSLSAVCGPGAFGPNGESEDNTFARWTPTASLSMSITNPALLDAFKAGQKFYVDFTAAE